MHTRPLGASGLDVPVVGMGTYRTFDVPDPAEVEPVVDAALETGTILFDSSPMYGKAERVLGAALNGRRDQVLVATKVWTDDDAEAERQIDRALGYYGGHVDLYQVHNLVATSTRLQQLERRQARGQLTAIGITHYRHEAFPELMRCMRSGRVTSIQVPYNPIDRLVEREVLPLASELNLGVLVMRPLQVGELAKKPPPASEWQSRLESFGVTTWPQVVLKWVLSDERVSCVIPATRDPAHARDNAAAGEPPWFGPDEREYVARLAASA